LKQQKWKESDKETWRLMRQIVGKEEVQSLSVEDINNFPCEDLRTLDQLWVKYSNGRVGFSVQIKMTERKKSIVSLPIDFSQLSR